MRVGPSEHCGRVCYSENYAIADYVIHVARKFCTEVMLFRQGHLHFVRYCEVYVTSIVGGVISRSDLYMAG